MKSVTIWLSDEEMRLIRSYAAQERRSVSDVIRSAVLDRIEDEYDISGFDMALNEYALEPVSYSLDEIKTRHGLK